MQRSLLPRSHPELQGLEIGEVYQPSARVDVGGDVYDFLELGDGRLAVVLGDVTGHGIEATADMAMAKFVFRSLAREHPEPADFLASANDVVVDEIAPGKFITMIYLAVDSSTGSVVAACAGHPAPLLVAPDGTVEQLGVHGLALGVDARADVRGEVGDARARRRARRLHRRCDRGAPRRRVLRCRTSDRGRRRVAPASRGRDRTHRRWKTAAAFAGDLTDDCALVVLKR